jgi:hypothetical protein
MFRYLSLVSDLGHLWRDWVRHELLQNVKANREGGVHVVLRACPTNDDSVIFGKVQ